LRFLKSYFGETHANKAPNGTVDVVLKLSDAISA
jgi:hypothetical protein